jgi:hypothetical protein
LVFGVERILGQLICCCRPCKTHKEAGAGAGPRKQEVLMDIGGYLRQGMKRMGGWDWASAHCLEKIQEMLRKAIKDQEDLWNMLLASTSSPELQQQRSAASELQGVEAGVYGSEPGQLEAAAAGSNRQEQQLNHTCSCASEFTPTMWNLRHLTAKVENSLDWCHLALCRIKEFTSHSPRSIEPIVKQQAATSTLRYPKLHDACFDPPSNSCKGHSRRAGPRELATHTGWNTLSSWWLHELLHQ